MDSGSRFPASARYAILGAVSAAVIAMVIAQGRVPQDQDYHRFADTRVMAGIPNFVNVATNLAFMLSGIAGMSAVLRRRRHRDTFAKPREALSYLVFFGGLVLVAAGSACYHLAPRDWTLLWDRLPMTVSFMAFFAIVIGERLGPRAGLAALPVLVVLGLASVLHWYAGERLGGGDLRAYVLVQFYPIAIIPLVSALLPGRYTLGWVFSAVIAIYAGSKLLEVHDAWILDALGGAVSGHSLKHLVAAAAPLPLLWMIGKRTPRPTAGA